MSKPRIGSDPLDDLIPGQPAKIHRPPSTVHRPPSPKSTKSAPKKRAATKPAAVPAASWEATHERVTFHCPRAVIDAVEAEVTRGARSKSRVIVDALREHLKVR